MMLKRLARRWNPEKALKGETKYHLFSARSFLTAMYGDAMVEEITEAWKKTSPVELNAYRTDVECNCGIEGCEACETDAEECTDNTRIEIPDWENGEGIILSPTWYAAPTGSPEGDELGMDDYSKANAEFLAVVHLAAAVEHRQRAVAEEPVQAAVAAVEEHGGFGAGEDFEGANRGNFGVDEIGGHGLGLGLGVKGGLPGF